MPCIPAQVSAIDKRPVLRAGNDDRCVGSLVWATFGQRSGQRLVSIVRRMESQRARPQEDTASERGEEAKLQPNGPMPAPEWVEVVVPRQPPALNEAAARVLLPILLK